MKLRRNQMKLRRNQKISPKNFPFPRQEFAKFLGTYWANFQVGNETSSFLSCVSPVFLTSECDLARSSPCSGLPLLSQEVRRGRVGGVKILLYLCPTKQRRGHDIGGFSIWCTQSIESLAQLVQSITLTGWGSAVRIRQDSLKLLMLYD